MVVALCSAEPWLVTVLPHRDTDLRAITLEERGTAATEGSTGVESHIPAGRDEHGPTL